MCRIVYAGVHNIAALCQEVITLGSNQGECWSLCRTSQCPSVQYGRQYVKGRTLLDNNFVGHPGSWRKTEHLPRGSVSYLLRYAQDKLLLWIELISIHIMLWIGITEGNTSFEHLWPDTSSVDYISGVLSALLPASSSSTRLPSHPRPYAQLTTHISVSSLWNGSLRWLSLGWSALERCFIVNNIAEWVCKQYTADSFLWFYWCLIMPLIITDASTWHWKHNWG